MKHVEIRNGVNVNKTMYGKESFIVGEVICENEKFIRVHMTSCKTTTNDVVTSERHMDEIATFNFWKKVSNCQYGENEGKCVSYFSNMHFGIIEVVNA